MCKTLSDMPCMLPKLEEKVQRPNPLKSLGSGVFEIVDDYNTDTYRAVYAVRCDLCASLFPEEKQKRHSSTKTGHRLD